MARFPAGALLFVLCLGLAGALHAASDADCRSEWRAADGNGDGVLEGPEAARYLAYLRLRRDPLPEGGRLGRDAFLQACREDLFSARAADIGLRKAEAASLSAEQARDLALAAGYTSISSLVRDGDGLWRASAMKDGKATRIAVDPQGNVAPLGD